MALRIDRVAIKNYRNFLDMEIANFPASAVLVGENEVGKSNFLRALRLVLDPDMPIAERRLDIQDICELSADNVSAGVIVSVTLDLVGFDGDVTLESILSDFCVQADPFKARLTYEFGPKPSLQVEEPSEELRDDDEQEEAEPATLILEDYEWSLFGAGDPERPINTGDLQRIALQLVGALRDAENELTSLRRRNPLRQILADLTPDHDRLEQTADLLNRASAHLLADPTVGDIENSIHNEVRRLTGAALDLDPTLGLASANPDRLLRQARLYLDETRTRAVGDVSLGVANVVFLSLLFQAIEHRRKSRARAAIILAIEEPEAHLHVQIQRRLFKTLLAEEEGVLVTTHSPHLASVTPLDKIVLLRRDPTLGTQAFSATRASLTEAEKSDIERYLTVTRAELLFARFVILVEGDAEQYIVPALAAALGFDFDEFGVSVVNIQGTDFGPYWRLLGPDAFAVPAIAVTDGDEDLVRDGAVTAGLKRACQLVRGEHGDDIRTYLDKQREDGTYLNDKDSQLLRSHLMKHNVYVGRHTLEVDLARLLPETMTSAAADFLEAVAARNHRADVTTLSIASDSSEIRARLIGRVERIGKGRFAQRWVEYLGASDLRDQIELQYRTADGDYSRIAAGYLLAAIDWASRCIRSTPLFEDIVVEGG